MGIGIHRGHPKFEGPRSHQDSAEGLKQKNGWTNPSDIYLVKLERISPGKEENTRTKLTPTNTPVLLETGKQNKKDLMIASQKIRL